MKRIKNNLLDPSKLITKSGLASKIHVSPTEINNRIREGDYPVIVTMDGKELVYLGE